MKKLIRYKNFGVSKKGFTMVELLLYMGIFSILLIVLMQIFTSILSTHAESRTTSSVDQDGSYILARLAYDVGRSQNIAEPALGTSGTTLHIVGAGIDEIYEKIGEDLFLKNNTTGTKDKLNSTYTGADVNFTTIGNNNPGSKVTVKIVLTLTSNIKRVGGINQTGTFETTVQTR